jgi:glucose-6-phosphate isomerase
MYPSLKNTTKAFQKLKREIKNSETSVLESHNKNYQDDFLPSLVRKFSRYNNIVIIGMGGSILGAQSIYLYLKKKIKKKLFFFDNLDENLYLNFFKIKKLKNSCFVVVSKSGNTIETIVNLDAILSKIKLKNKLVVITEIKDNSLFYLATKFNAEIIEHKSYIGGRYSVLSEAGMFPAKLMGLETEKFRSLEKLINNKNFSSCLNKNVASIYSLFLRNLNNSVILNYDPSSIGLCEWYKQIISESLGKKGMGITPIISNCPKDHHSILQLYLDGPKNKFFTFFSSKSDNKKIDSIVDAQCKAVKNIFKKKKIPYREFFFNKKNENELGTIFTFFVLETILLARLMKVDPFNQPAVEEIKKETKKILG